MLGLQWDDFSSPCLLIFCEQRSKIGLNTPLMWLAVNIKNSNSSIYIKLWECGFYVKYFNTCWKSFASNFSIPKSFFILLFFFGEEDWPWANIFANLPLFCMCGAATAWLDEWCVGPLPGSKSVNHGLPKWSMWT